ncbi:malto-oligosyltrehalose trehalohydrolase [Cellulomonas sp. JZ18]|uniref:malto-oligosyltrehalose trehalohydrolase n=1 Tax=Cellulomonas sp. JZ18 TaxID=2654191 RepID=UPI0012D48AEB|nr:malto-oligosyltrehalose trehalohydrolase [Cellulomonas sp. JZ18]QGQ19482.1 malto-oligosyltrehalose trehalohydrolase [Cellulomonas sp. JZ18]
MTYVPEVWAPAAGRVELVLPSGAPEGVDVGGARADARGPGLRVPMDAVRDGWWRGPAPLPHGTDYAFALDGGPGRPDPRAAWLPDGVHGAARVFDAGRFAWTDTGWSGVDVRGKVFYELHVGTFTPEGTLTSAIERLDHLVGLGVDVVELLPVAGFNGRHGWGYDGVALWAVHEPYGGPEALQAFVDAAHARGLAVCLDVVHNHLGPSGNYLHEFGPYFTDEHHTPWGAAINLDQEGAEHVRRWIVDSVLRWARDFHVDAFRLDAVHALVDESDRHLLAQLSDEVAALSAELGRPLSLVAETDLNDVVSVTPTAEGGWGMTGQWADDVHHSIHALVTGERHGYYVDFGSPETLRTALTGAFVHTGEMSTFRGKPWGRPVPDDVDGHRFVVFDANHDQVGNRALGDRPSSRVDAGGLAAQAALVLLSPFTPLLFMGEEWGARTPWMFFTDHPEPELAEAVREGRTKEFGGHGWESLYGGEIEVPDPQDPATFERSRLDWSEPAQPEHARLLDWYRELVALRRQVPDLASGDRSRVALDVHAVEGQGDGPWQGALVLHRGDARVVLNLAHEPAAVPVPLSAPVEVRAAWDGGVVQPAEHPDGPVVVELPARSVVVLA